MRQILGREWEELSLDKVKRRCENFRSKFELVLANNGDNNFNG